MPVRLPEATFGLSAELGCRWLRSCRALPTASRFWKLPRSSNSLCNSSLRCCSSRLRVPRLPLLAGSRTPGFPPSAPHIRAFCECVGRTESETVPTNGRGLKICGSTLSHPTKRRLGGAPARSNRGVTSLHGCHGLNPQFGFRRSRATEQEPIIDFRSLPYTRCRRSIVRRYSCY